MTIKQIMFGLSALALSASLTPAAYAGTDTGTLTVKTRIGAACTLKTNGATLDFGTLTSVSDKDYEVETSIAVQCAKGQAYSIYMGSGQNAPNWSQKDGTRRMKSGSEFISYYICLDASRQTSWFDDKWEGSKENHIVRGTGDGTNQKYPVYGKIPKQGTPSAGDYTDTVMVTVKY